MSGTDRHQAGFTLIELMVAIVLALVLTGGVVAMFLAGKQAYRTAEAQSRVQEDARFAMEYVARYVRMAGYRADPFGNRALSDPIRPCSDAPDGSNTCDDANNSRPGAVLAIRYQVFPGDVACDGSIPNAATNTEPDVTEAVFSVLADNQAGGRSLHCNGAPLVRGIRKLQVSYLTIDDNGDTRVLGPGEIMKGNRLARVGAVKLRVQVDSPDAGNANPGINGGDDLKREFRTTVYLRNLCRACERIHAANIAAEE